MNERDFCFWLQGYLELADADKNKMGDSLSIEQVKCIKEHLALVFKPTIVMDKGQSIDPGFLTGGVALDQIKYC